VLGRTADLEEDVHSARRGFRPRPCSSRRDLFRYGTSYVQFHKKEVVKAVGDFDESLGVGSDTPYRSGEDTDYVLRAFARGFKTAHAPDVTVRHPAVNLRDPALPEKVRAYAKGRMRLLRKHNMPLWFTLANVVYPLARIPADCLPVIRYRWNMFTARLGALG
jgi:GT2 family glycosyltransferase